MERRHRACKDLAADRLSTRTNHPVAAYVCQPGDSTWRALALDVLRIEDGLITEIVVFPPDNFPLFGLPILMDPAPEMNKCH